MEMEDPPGGQGPPGPQGHPGPVETCDSPDSPYNTRYLCFGEYFQFSGTVYATIGQGTRSNE